MKKIATLDILLLNENILGMQLKHDLVVDPDLSNDDKITVFMSMLVILRDEYMDNCMKVGMTKEQAIHMFNMSTDFNDKQEEMDAYLNDLTQREYTPEERAIIDDDRSQE